MVRIDIVHLSNKIVSLEQWFGQISIRVDDFFGVRYVLSNHSTLANFNRRVRFLNYVAGGDIGYALTHNDLT